MEIPFEPSAGATVRLVEAPAGWFWSTSDDASRFTLKPPYGASGTHIARFELTCAGTTQRADVALTVRPLRWSTPVTWTPPENGPPAREHAAFWFDEDDPDHLYVFGGHLFEPKQWTVAWDLWRLDLSTGTWDELTAQGAIPQRAAGRVAAVPGERAILFSGGERPDLSIPDALERFDVATSTWTSVALGGARANGDMLHALLHDAPSDRYVSLCGFTGASIHCDVHAITLTSTGATQTKLTPVVNGGGAGPDPRYGFFHAYDAETERVIVFSGGGWPSPSDPVNPASDTWALDLSQDPPVWTPLGTAPEFAARNGCYALDPVGHRLFAWGGTPDGATTVPGVRVLDLDEGFESWQLIDVPNAPPIRSSCSAVYDAKRHRILFGFGNSATGIYADLHALEL